MSTPTISVSTGAGRRIWLAGIIAVVAAIAANLIVRALLFAWLDLPAGFPPLQPGAIIFFTIVGVGLGAVVYAMVARRSMQPARTFTWIAITALVVSILPNLGLMLNPAAGPFPGGSPLAYGILILFHIIAGFIAIGVITRLGRSG